VPSQHVVRLEFIKDNETVTGFETWWQTAKAFSPVIRDTWIKTTTTWF